MASAVADCYFEHIAIITRVAPIPNFTDTSSSYPSIAIKCIDTDTWLQSTMTNLLLQHFGVGAQRVTFIRILASVPVLLCRVLASNAYCAW